MAHGQEVLTSVMADALARFDVTKGAIIELCAQAKAIKVSGPADTEGMAAARKMRLHLKNIRVEGEKRRKALNEDALRYQKTVNAAAHELFDPVEEAEAHLQREEDTAERERQRIEAEAAARAEAERKAKIDARLARLAAVEAIPSSLAWLETATDADFSAAVETASRQREDRKVAAAKAEQERVTREAEAREAQRLESERIARERAVLEAQLAEQRAAEAKLAAERAEVEAAQRKVAEEAAAAKRAKEIEDAKVRAAEEERIRMERAKAAQEAEAARREALKPDVQRVRDFARAVQSLDMPNTKAAEQIRAILVNAGIQILEVAARMERGS